MNTANPLYRFACLILTILCGACSTPYRPEVFHSGEQQAMKTTVCIVDKVSDAEIPLATWKNGAQNGSIYGQAAGEAVASLGGLSVPLGIAIILIGSAAGKVVGVISDNSGNTIKGQQLVVTPVQGGEQILLFQPSQTKKLKQGDRVRIVEGSFFARLDPISE